MGVDTVGKLKGRVTQEQVLNFIRQRYDKNATSYVDKSYCGNEPTWEHKKYGDDKFFCESGYIQFKSKYNNQRNLFYSYTNINSFENLKYYEKYGLKDMVLSEKTHIGLGHDEEAIQIIKEIVTEFGGWIDENDCDDKEFYPILKNSDGSIKPVYYVTMEDIYEKFGGVVIIKK